MSFIPTSVDVVENLRPLVTVLVTFVFQTTVEGLMLLRTRRGDKRERAAGKRWFKRFRLLVLAILVIETVFGLIPDALGAAWIGYLLKKIADEKLEERFPEKKHSFRRRRM